MKPTIFEILLQHTESHGMGNRSYFDHLIIWIDRKIASTSAIKELIALSPKNNIHDLNNLPGYIHLDRKLELFQLSAAALCLLRDGCVGVGDYKINTVEIALDFYSQDVTKIHGLRTFLNKHLSNKRKPRKNHQYHFAVDSDLFDLQLDPKTLYRNSEIQSTTHYHHLTTLDKFRFALYSEPTNYRWDEEYGYVHLEYRNVGKAKVEKLGIMTINDLIELDHPQFWTNQLKLSYPKLKELGKLYSQGQSNMCYNKNGNKFFNQLICLQAYLNQFPDHEDCFAPITTAGRLIKACKF